MSKYNDDHYLYLKTHNPEARDPNYVLQSLRATLLLASDRDYPYVLNQVNDPPPALYIRGTLPDTTHALAVVGSRKHTAYGVAMTQDIVGQAVRAGAVIVSGLAYGIDAIAHRAALSHGGKTIAVLPCGIDRVYPEGHVQLVNDIIASGGAVVSEFPLGSIPFRHHFLVRNRIIAGLCKVTVVVEAAQRSGAISTATHALGYGRIVMAVPGNINSTYSVGTNALIDRGAGMVLSSDDVVRELAIPMRPDSTSTLLSLEDRRLLDYIPKSGIRLEELVSLLQLDFATISSKVILLELKGLVRQAGEGIYRRLV